MCWDFFYQTGEVTDSYNCFSLNEDIAGQNLSEIMMMMMTMITVMNKAGQLWLKQLVLYLC